MADTPAPAPASAGAARAAPGTPEGARRRVLVADDEEGIRNFVTRVLRALPHVDVVTVPSGEAGVDALKDAWFDVIISDAHMGAMDGVRFLQLASELAEGAPRILITGEADIPTTQAAVNHAHVSCFLPKPFMPKDLLDVVKPLLDARRHEANRETAFQRAMPEGQRS